MLWSGLCLCVWEAEAERREDRCVSYAGPLLLGQSGVVRLFVVTGQRHFIQFSFPVGLATNGLATVTRRGG